MQIDYIHGMKKLQGFSLCLWKMVEGIALDNLRLLGPLTFHIFLMFCLGTEGVQVLPNQTLRYRELQCSSWGLSCISLSVSLGSS